MQTTNPISLRLMSTFCPIILKVKESRPQGAARRSAPIRQAIAFWV